MKPSTNTSVNMGKQPQAIRQNRPTGRQLDSHRPLLSFSAAIITAYLSLAALSQAETIPGCGPDSGCDKVLDSKWASGSIPPPLPASGYTRFSLSVHLELREATARKPSGR